VTLYYIVKYNNRCQIDIITFIDFTAVVRYVGRYVDKYDSVKYYFFFSETRMRGNMKCVYTNRTEFDIRDDF